MICPNCKKEFEIQNKHYKCECGICPPVEFYNYKLTQQDIDKLVLEGITDEIEFYSKAKKKKFKARLKLNKERIDFDFRENKTSDVNKRDNSAIFVFINALNSGLIRVFIVDGQAQFYRPAKEDWFYGEKTNRNSTTI